jgi:hypothetical protein
MDLTILGAGVLIAILNADDDDLERAGEARSATGHHWRNR